MEHSGSGLGMFRCITEQTEQYTRTRKLTRQQYAHVVHDLDRQEMYRPHVQ